MSTYKGAKVLGNIGSESIPAPTQGMNSQEELTFTNSAPDDKEWTAMIKLLNEWTTPDRYLRSIIQYARSGPHYPADMHVNLLEQLIEARERAARIDERSIYIKDHIRGKNSAFIARVKNAVQHAHSFDANSQSCNCGVSKMFLIEAKDEIAELKSQGEQG